MSYKSELVKIFESLSKIELSKGRYFPSRAFATSMRQIENSVNYKISGSRITLYMLNNSIVVLGQSSSDVFIDYLNTGRSSRLDSDIRYLVESSDLTNVSGIGESKAEILIKSGIDSVNRLNKLNLNIGDKIPGTNITYSRNIDTGLKFYLATNNERIPRELAKDYLIDFKNYLISKKLDYLEIYPVGSYRRHKSTIGDIDIILTPKVGYEIAGDELTQVSDWFDSLFVSGSTKVAGIKGKTQVDIRLIDRKYLGAHILHGTGSQEFNIKLRAHAKSLGYRLNEYGIVVGDELITFDNELDIFKYLNYQYVEPKYR